MSENNNNHHDNSNRMEHKIDAIKDGVSNLNAQVGRLAERLDHQKSDFVRLEEKVDSVEEKASKAQASATEARAKLDTWVNRGIGLWGGAMALWAIANSKIFLQLIGAH